MIVVPTLPVRTRCTCRPILAWHGFALHAFHCAVMVDGLRRARARWN